MARVKTEIEGMRYFRVALAIQREQAEMRRAKNYDWARAEKLGKLNARVLSRLDELSAQIGDEIMDVLNPQGIMPEQGYCGAAQ